MICRTCEQTELSTHAVVRVYDQLKMAERAHRTIKDTLDARPIRHHLTDRAEAHFFLFLFAYHLFFELHARLAPMLFTDDTPLAPTDPVAPARRSPAANTKAGSARTPDGLPAYNLTNPNTVQAKALEQLNVKLGT